MNLEYADLRRLMYWYGNETKNEAEAETIGGRMVLDAALCRVGIRINNGDVVVDSLGKPYLPQSPGIEFNITHKNGFVACILSPGEGRVGIDAEPAEGAVREKHMDRFAKKYFSENENEAWRSGRRSFSEIWTRKEAYLKMLGCGIGKDIRSFDTEDTEGVFFKTFDINGFTVTVASENEAEISLYDQEKQ